MTLAPVKHDFSKAWVRGWEHIAQEGTSYFQRLREARGWSRQDVWDLTDGHLDPGVQAVYEGEWAPAWAPDVDTLIDLAHIYGTSPGQLLDGCFEEKGRELLAEEEEDERKS